MRKQEVSSVTIHIRITTSSNKKMVQCANENENITEEPTAVHYSAGNQFTDTLLKIAS